jgi:death-on-curing protein
MIRIPTLEEIIILHGLIIDQSGGTNGIRDFGALESALAQPQMMFDGVELYPDIIAKAASLGFSLICNHPFLDGNKRIGHAATEILLLLNGLEIIAGTNEQEKVILDLASGKVKREEFIAWVRSITKQIDSTQQG